MVIVYFISISTASDSLRERWLAEYYNNFKYIRYPPKYINMSFTDSVRSKQKWYQ